MLRVITLIALHYPLGSTRAGIIAISAGYDHSMMLKEDGSVWMAGGNTYGQLGTNNKHDKTSFVEVISSGW